MADVATPYLTTVEVADLLRKTPDYVARQCAKHKAGDRAALKGQKLGNEWRVHRDDLESFMRGGSTAPPTRSRRRRVA